MIHSALQDVMRRREELARLDKAMNELVMIAKSEKRLHLDDRLNRTAPRCARLTRVKISDKYSFDELH